MHTYIAAGENPVFHIFCGVDVLGLKTFCDSFLVYSSCCRVFKVLFCFRISFLTLFTKNMREDIECNRAIKSTKNMSIGVDCVCVYLLNCT